MSRWSSRVPLEPDTTPKRRLKLDTTSGTPFRALIPLLALLHGVSPSAQAPQFSHERPITPAAAGPQRLAVDLPLLRDAARFRVVQRGDRWIAEGGLSDLRLFNADGKGVPYLLLYPPDPEPDWTRGTLLPIAATKTTSGFEADLGALQRVDAVRVDGIPPPYLKRVTLEGSGDRRRWTVLAAEGTLFDLPAERMRQTELWFAPGEYRYLRLSWDDTNSGRVRVPRGAAARRTVRTGVAAPSKIDVAFERGASEPGRTRYRIRLQAVRMPIVALELEVGGGHVFRQAAVTESRFAGTEAAPVQLGTATLSRVVRDGVHASNLRISIAPPSESELQLLIEDAGNPPLDVKRISAELAELPVIFFEQQDGPLIARYGNPTLEAPSYDLEAMRASIDVTKVNEATWGEPRAPVETGAPAAPASAPEPGSVLETGGFAHVRQISGAPAGLATLQLDASALANSRGPAGRFADVRVLDGSDRQIPYLLERRGEPLEVPLSIGRVGSKAVELETAPGQHRSVYRVSLLHEGLPPATLVLDSPGRVFQRNVQIGFERPPDRRHRDTWFDVRSTTVWRHANEETPALPLSIRLERAGPRDVLVVIDEGDNAPLPISGARLLLPSYRLRFYHPRDASLRLAYGRDDLEAPEYDLALLARQVMGAAAREVSAVPEAATDGGSPAPIIPPWTFWTLLGVAVVVLIAMIGRLARSA